MKDVKSKTWKYFQQIGVIVAFIASIGTFTGIYYQFQTKKAQIEIQLLSVDYLTANNNFKNLSSNYEYKGTPVKNLWLLKYKILNTGNLTIIGTGKNQNIIGNKIKIKYHTGVQIVDNIELTQKELPLDIEKEDSVTISFYFDQWRKNESAMFSIYLKSEEIINNFLPFVINRPIIDGDILINDYRIPSKTEKIPIIDYLPTPITNSIRVVLPILASFILLGIAFLFSLSTTDWLKNRIWRKKYFERFKLFVTTDIFNEEYKELFKTELQKIKFKKGIDTIVKSPWRLQDKYWKYFKGEKIPVYSPLFVSFKDFYISLFVFVFIILFLLSIILSVIKL